MGKILNDLNLSSDYEMKQNVSKLSHSIIIVYMYDTFKLNWILMIFHTFSMFYIILNVSTYLIFTLKYINVEMWCVV